MSKRQEITKIINKVLEYGKHHKFPYFDDNEKINKFKQEYTTDHCAGLINKYFVPAYDESLDTLKAYFKAETERVRLLGIINNADKKCLKFQLSEIHEDYVINCIVEIIKILRS